MDKKLKIALIATAVLMVIVIVLAVLFVNRTDEEEQFLEESEKQWAEDAANSAYPFKWKRTSEGSLELTLTGQWGNTTWTSVLDDETVATVAQKSMESEKIVYTITAVDEGYTVLYLTGTKAGMPAGTEYEIVLTLRVDSNKNVSVAYSEIKDSLLQEAGFGDYAYVLTQKGFETVSLQIFYLGAAGGSDPYDGWAVEQEGDFYAVQGPLTGEESVAFNFFSKGSGTGVCRIVNEKLGKTISFVVTVGEDMSILLVRSFTD